MLVYVQSSQFEKITRDLNAADIPKHILNYHEDMKIEKKIRERNRNFLKVRMFDFSNIAETKGTFSKIHLPPLTTLAKQLSSSTNELKSIRQ